MPVLFDFCVYIYINVRRQGNWQVFFRKKECFLDECLCSSAVEHFLGKEEVPSSSLGTGSKKGEKYNYF